jgi:GTPase
VASQGKSEFLIQKKLIEKEDSIIVSGTVSQGYIKKNQLLWIGPFLNGRFRYLTKSKKYSRETRVQSIHCYKIEVKKSNCGQSCSIAFQVTGAIKKGLQTSTIRSGMVLVESHSEPKGVMEFLADFKLSDDNDIEQTCPAAYEPVVTSSSFRQCCTILPSGDEPTPSPPPKKT